MSRWFTRLIPMDEQCYSSCIDQAKIIASPSYCKWTSQTKAERQPTLKQMDEPRWALRTSKPEQGISHTPSISGRSYHSKGGGTIAKADWITAITEVWAIVDRDGHAHSKSGWPYHCRKRRGHTINAKASSISAQLDAPNCCFLLPPYNYQLLVYPGPIIAMYLVFFWMCLFSLLLYFLVHQVWHWIASSSLDQDY